jgi:hypothetical protein
MQALSISVGIALHPNAPAVLIRTAMAFRISLTGVLAETTELTPTVTEFLTPAIAVRT